ncbi:MAG: transketolase [Ignavibacteriaceae bacterium]|nr:transketolase [Ignavibacteriaceae bacterium]
MTYEEILINELGQNENLLVLTAENRAAIRNIPNLKPERFFDFGIAEQTMIGAAAGLALRGKLPVAHALASFLTMRAFEFIRTDIGIPNLPVKIVGSFAGLLSEANGPTHQAIEDISLMRGIPNMNVICPSDAEDLAICLPVILKSDSPYYIRFTNLQSSIKHNPVFTPGKAESILEDGYDVTILTYGCLLKEAVIAAEILQSENISVGLINLRTLKPIDSEKILEVCKSSSLIVTLEDHFRVGGLYSILCELLISEQMMANILPIAFDNKWFKPALLSDVLIFEEMDGKSIARKIKHSLSKSRIFLNQFNT